MSNLDPMSTIATVRMTNRFLALVDSYRGNKTVTLHEVMEIFSDPYRSVGFNPETHSFYNQQQLLTSMWAFIVLPKERFFEDLPGDKIRELNKKWGLSGLEMDVGLDFFVRKLRNSISHARFSVSEELLFTFADNAKFKFSIDGESLQIFVQAFAYWVLTKDIELKGL